MNLGVPHGPSLPGAANSVIHRRERGEVTHPFMPPAQGVCACRGALELLGVLGSRGAGAAQLSPFLLGGTWMGQGEHVCCRGALSTGMDPHGNAGMLLLLLPPLSLLPGGLLAGLSPGLEDHPKAWDLNLGLGKVALLREDRAEGIPSALSHSSSPFRCGGGGMLWHPSAEIPVLQPRGSPPPWMDEGLWHPREGCGVQGSSCGTFVPGLEA